MEIDQFNTAKILTNKLEHIALDERQISRISEIESANEYVYLIGYLSKNEYCREVIKNIVLGFIKKEKDDLENQFKNL